MVLTIDLLGRTGDGASAWESRLLLFGEARQQLLNLGDGAAGVEALKTIKKLEILEYYLEYLKKFNLIVTSY